MKDKTLRRIGGVVLMVAAYPVAIYTGDGISLLMGLFGLAACFVGD